MPPGIFMWSVNQQDMKINATFKLVMNRWSWHFGLIEIKRRQLVSQIPWNVRMNDKCWQIQTIHLQIPVPPQHRGGGVRLLAGVAVWLRAADLRRHPLPARDRGGGGEQGSGGGAPAPARHLLSKASRDIWIVGLSIVTTYFLHHFSAMFGSAIKIFCISILSSPARDCLPRQQNRWSLSSVRQLFQFELNEVKERDEQFITCRNLQDHNPSSANLPRLPQSVLSQHRDRGQQ